MRAWLLWLLEWLVAGAAFVVVMGVPLWLSEAWLDWRRRRRGIRRNDFMLNRRWEIAVSLLLLYGLMLALALALGAFSIALGRLLRHLRLL